MKDGLITIEVETPHGSFLRTIRPATLIPEGVDRGPAAEAATRGAAAIYGMPDFVFHPAVEPRIPQLDLTRVSMAGDPLEWLG